MIRFFSLLILSISLLACQNNSGGATEMPEDSIKNKGLAKTPQQKPEECYRYIAARDTYDIKITRNGNLVSGHMSFNNFQKDDSRGNFTGTYVSDNTLKIIYRFESEGMKSIREIFLRDEGNRLVTGIGEEDVEGDSAFSKKPENISFSGVAYKKVDCSEIQ